MKLRFRGFVLVLSALFFALGVSMSDVSSSSAVELNRPAPEFTLTSYDGKPVSLADFKGKTVVLEWFNPECPFVMKHYKSGHMQKMQAQAKKEGVIWLSINSTDSKHKNFQTAEDISQFKKENSVKDTELLVDPDGKVGKLYHAKTTPHMFVINSEGTLVYDGAIDDQADSDGEPDKAKNFVSLALEDLKSGKKVSTAATSPYGCSVKYAT